MEHECNFNVVASMCAQVNASSPFRKQLIIVWYCMRTRTRRNRNKPARHHVCQRFAVKHAHNLAIRNAIIIGHTVVHRTFSCAPISYLRVRCCHRCRTPMRLLVFPGLARVSTGAPKTNESTLSTSFLYVYMVYDFLTTSHKYDLSDLCDSVWLNTSYISK